MAPLPEHRIMPAPVFHTTAIDLFGPFTFRDMVKKRTTGKGWGVIFVCTASSAIHIELTESYGMDSFLQALRRFVCIHGSPKKIISDQGDQLVAASKRVVNWDFSEVKSWGAARRISWELVPVGGQHMNGQAEKIGRAHV